MIIQISFWKSYAVLSILTETALLALPAYIMWNVQIRMKLKFTIIGWFSVRML